jgi:hypothetical protein
MPSKSSENPHVQDRFDEATALRLPRMTIGRWMIVIAVMAIDFAAMAQKFSDPLATVATFSTMAILILAAPLLLLLSLAEEE